MSWEEKNLAIFSVLITCLFAVSNLPWTLDDYDQAKQAFVSYQMIGQQRWFYQTTPHEGMAGNPKRHSSHHINSKPPAFACISAGLYEIGRSWGFAWRFPSFAAAVALAFLVFRSRSVGRGTVALGSFFLPGYSGKEERRPVQLWIRGAAAA